MIPKNPTASSSTVFNLERFFLSVGSLFELKFKGVEPLSVFISSCTAKGVGFRISVGSSFDCASGFISFCCFSSSSWRNFSHDWANGAQVKGEGFQPDSGSDGCVDSTCTFSILGGDSEALWGYLLSIDCGVAGLYSSLGIWAIAGAVAGGMVLGSIIFGAQGASPGENIPIDEKSGSAF